MFCPDRVIDPPAETKDYKCPACGENIPGSTQLYKTISGKVIGCEKCIHTVDACEQYGE